MSMISSLIDELRKSADEWNGSNMFELARMCNDAADTIWQLRDDLQRANAAVQDAEHDESMAWDRVRKAEAESASLRGAAQGLGELCDKYKAENTKLRELAKKLVILAFARCADCDLLNASCALVSTQKCLLWNECESIARELGIEVSE